MKTIHVSIGPVQSFISQARRTRDLLAGSFILSYLSGHAMAQVLREEGQILYPWVHEAEGDPLSTIRDPLLRWIVGNQDGKSDPPWVGSLPNRFAARIPFKMEPCLVKVAVNQAWLQIAEAVRRKVFPDGWPSDETRKIWERQVTGFWEIVWVLGEEAECLNYRKYWRTHFPLEEPGDKCSLTGNLQELSGMIRTHDRSRQQAFWTEIQNRVSSFNLQENERLSAIALIKRLFPLVAKEALGWQLPDNAKYFPSTASLAASSWIRSLGEDRSKEVDQFTEVAEKAGIRCMEDPGVELTGLNPSFYKLEGSVFFSSNLERENFWEENGRNNEHKQALRQAWDKLTRDGKDQPSPYYALLLMDGDRLGEWLREHGSRVSEALSEFTGEVATMIQSAYGYPVYAGGDDVLALLPLESGLPVTAQLRKTYCCAFSKAGMSGASISAGLVYAHYKAPLQKVLDFAHMLLDDRAKGDSGRDSLAVGVWKGGGPVWTWAAPWEIALQEKKGTRTALEIMADGIRSQRAFSSSFFYHAQARLKPLQPSGEEKEAITSYQEMIEKILVAEYIRSNPDTKREQAEVWIKPLLRLCLGSWRDDRGKLHSMERPFQIDGALIARFLATEGRVSNEMVEI